jgi:LuxR family maltose regulon positive regulatory protein
MQRYVDGALRRTPEEPPSPMRVLAQALQAGLWLWEGRVDDAAARLARADNDARWLNRPPNVAGYLNLFAGLTCAVRGERDAALAAAQARLDGLDDERTSGRRETWLSHFLYAKLRVAMILDDAATVREIASRLAERANPDEVPLFVRERLPLPGHLAALDARWADAAAAYAKALDDEAGIDLYGQAIETRMRLAHALVMQRRIAEAARALVPVFDRVAASAEPGPALFAGSRALDALSATPWGTGLAPEAVQTLQRWSRQLRAMRTADTAPSCPSHWPPPRSRRSSAAANARCWRASRRATATSSSRVPSTSARTR